MILKMMQKQASGGLNMERIITQYPLKIVQKMDEIVRKEKFSSRAEFIRETIREAIFQRRLAAKESAMAVEE